jgi:hypothetical protein
MAKKKVTASALMALALNFSFWTMARTALPETGPVQPEAVTPASLDSGFTQLYKLNFEDARKDFLSYQELQPHDPMGKAAEAASYLYQEFNRKGVFTSSFFLDDAKFLHGVPGNPSENRNDSFLRLNKQARQMATELLKSDPRDTHGLLVLTISDGMESDYDALIEKKQRAALSMMRRAEREAKTLLSIDHTADDAYLALGASNYIIGSLPSHKRFFLKISGVQGDKERGMQQMRQAAEHGHYLKPFAEILLALVYEREHQFDQARILLVALTRQFPENPLFARELSRLQRNR